MRLVSTSGMWAPLEVPWPRRPAIPRDLRPQRERGAIATAAEVSRYAISSPGAKVHKTQPSLRPTIEGDRSWRSASGFRACSAWSSAAITEDIHPEKVHENSPSTDTPDCPEGRHYAFPAQTSSWYRNLAPACRIPSTYANAAFSSTFDSSWTMRWMAARTSGAIRLASPQT